MNYLISGGETADGTQQDFLIADGKIVKVGANLAKADAIQIDATGCKILPGLVDLHTHLREPGREDSETVLTGSTAAVVGGYTAISAMANTNPVADTAGVVEQIFRLGQEAGLCDVFPIGAVTQGLNGENLAEIGAMANSAARVRVFSDDGKCSHASCTGICKELWGSYRPACARATIDPRCSNE